MNLIPIVDYYYNHHHWLSSIYIIYFMKILAVSSVSQHFRTRSLLIYNVVNWSSSTFFYVFSIQVRNYRTVLKTQIKYLYSVVEYTYQIRHDLYYVFSCFWYEFIQINRKSVILSLFIILLNALIVMIYFLYKHMNIINMNNYISVVRTIL